MESAAISSREAGQEQEGGQPASGRPTLNPAAEKLLSYLTGLAPVGEFFEPRLSGIMADLGYRQKVSIYRSLGELIRKGCVAKLACGANGTIGVLAVRKRLEELEHRHLPKPKGVPAELGETNRAERAGRVSPEDWAARIAEMPDDTRDFTARYFGDPIPDDPRRHWLRRVPPRRLVRKVA
jgi:hypothetical protein